MLLKELKIHEVGKMKLEYCKTEMQLVDMLKKAKLDHLKKLIRMERF